MKTIDLSGTWRYEEDLENRGIAERFYARPLAKDGFTVPGDACSNKIGKPYTSPEKLCYEAVRALRPKYEYIGALWLQREFTLPDCCEGKHITLFLERVNIASDLWIDGTKIDRRIIEISAPHIYNLTGRLSAGEHTITLRIDNSNLLNIDIMASGYGVHTQSVWNGIIGAAQLRIEDIFHISNVQLYPDGECVHVKLTANSDCAKPRDRRAAMFTARAVSPSGETLMSVSADFTLYNKKQVVRFDYPIKNPQMWSEHNPALYTMNIEMVYDGRITDEKSVTFGMRTVAADKHDFLVNGRKTALRGTLDCGIYPLTGYPPTDLDTWLKLFCTLREYGLNHVRFHSWCPPEAAFTAADMTGFYVLAEMPLWLNTDVCALEFGDDPIHAVYFQNEAVKISETYGNHPSFIMFSNGNEILGSHELLETITTQIKALDPRRLYTLTSNFDRPLSPADDYFSAVEVNGRRIRVQVFHDVVSEHTRLSYDEATESIGCPVVSFEAGQYCVYPDADSAGDYTGNLQPANFEFIKREMIRRNVYHMLDKFKKASGAFAALMYKEEIEASLRTVHMGGFELLGLADYTGQGTATVGLLDVFCKSKNIITAEEFRSFCNDVVPLMKADRVFKNTDSFTADFALYDYGEKKISNPLFKFRVKNGGKIIYETETHKTSVSFPLDCIKEPSMLKCYLTVGEYTNTWNVFVYTENTLEYAALTLDGADGKFWEIAENGGRAVVRMTAENLKNPIEGMFKPTFWSPAHFPSERTNGLMIDSRHKALAAFPTTDYADFQWKHPIDNCICADVSMLGAELEYIVEPVPNFYSNIRRSPLFEAKVGKGSFLLCGFDFDIQKTTVAALGASIYRYVCSGDFEPKQTLSAESIKMLFR